MSWQRIVSTVAVGVATSVGVAAGQGAPSMPSAPVSSITAVPGITVGQFTRTERPTGCTVVLAPPNTVGAVDVRGGAPGTRETNVMAPDNTVSVVHAVVLSGGSAYGLSVADGVMKFLEEKHVGFPVGSSVVPIVPAAILFDLNVGGHPEIRPDAACGYAAASRASRVVEEGSVGAGAGATVGKLAGPTRAMKGGIGTAAIALPNGLIVGAIVAVNAIGTVVDPRTGAPIAGVRTADGHGLEDPHALIRRGSGGAGELLANTTIGVVATNAALTKAQALRVTEMAHDGMARAIVPSHTPMDGDTLFTLATGERTGEPDIRTVGALAAEAVADAIVNAVRKAKGVAGYLAASEIK